MSVAIDKIEDLSITPLIQLVMKGLHRKYSTSFQFYQVRPINEILSGQIDSPQCIHLQDIRAFVEETEFLRRVYFYRTLTGRSEIDHRIKLCADFYSKVIPIAHHYPMMIITNTRSLFLKRNHRLKKIQAGEGSSDESEPQDEPFEQCNEPSSCDFLDDLENSSLEEDRCEQQSGSSYDSSQHDLFGENSQEVQENTFIDFKVIEQSNLTHLIADFTEKEDKEDCQSTAACISKAALITIDNKLFPEKNISVTSIPTIKFSLQKKKSSLSNYLDLLRENRGQILSGLPSGLQNTSGNEQTKMMPSQTNTAPSTQENKSERTQRENKRKRIRQKAEELLRRAKNDMEGGNILCL